MIKAERHDRILAELAKRGAIGVQELAELLDASAATIRRDIGELDGAGSVVRTHGGVTLRDTREELPYDAKVMALLPEKRRIGAMAASMLRPSLSVGCGGGTTVMQMITAIKRMSLHITTTAINVALELRDAEHIDVLVTGGTLRGRTAEVVGHVAERTLRDVNLDIAIIGADGVDPELGLTTYDHAEAFVNRTLIERAKEVWILADHSKFGQSRPAVIVPIEFAHKIITDTGVAPDMVERIEKRGPQVIKA
jgi:DeoR/GlpR family transcriptional regulator of sugar metabolism